MSKKSRRRNKRLAALAGLLGGAMLLGRGKGTAFSRPKAGTIDQMAKDVKVETPKVFQDDIMRGGSGVKFMPKRNPKSIRPGVNTPFNPKSIIRNQDGSITQGGITFPNRDAFRNRAVMPSNLSRNMGMQRTPVIDDSFFSDAMAKDGGKIVKTETGGKAVRPKKKKRIQVQGFGKARR